MYFLTHYGVLQHVLSSIKTSYFSGRLETGRSSPLHYSSTRSLTSALCFPRELFLATSPPRPLCIATAEASEHYLRFVVERLPRSLDQCRATDLPPVSGSRTAANPRRVAHQQTLCSQISAPRRPLFLFCTSNLLWFI